MGDLRCYYDGCGKQGRWFIWYHDCTLPVDGVNITYNTVCAEHLHQHVEEWGDHPEYPITCIRPAGNLEDGLGVRHGAGIRGSMTEILLLDAPLGLVQELMKGQRVESVEHLPGSAEVWVTLGSGLTIVVWLGVDNGLAFRIQKRDKQGG